MKEKTAKNGATEQTAEQDKTKVHHYLKILKFSVFINM